MRVRDAREAARQWVIEEAARIPGFCGAYTAGSNNWLPDDAHVPDTSDFDIMVVLEDSEAHDATGRRGKFRYREVLLEASHLSFDQFRSPELVLSDYHLAPSFRTANILLDPSGHLTGLHKIVCRDYARRYWVRQRCLNASDRVLSHLERENEEGCLFGAGVSTHLLLAAGLRNPTVRTRYVAVRDLLEEYEDLEFHERLLDLLGVSRMSRERAEKHLSTLADVFDAATPCMRKPFPFACYISEMGRKLAIDGSREMIGRGYHREAMFWIAVTHSRCQRILTEAQTPHTFGESFQDLLSDLGISSADGIRQRCDEIRRVLPRVQNMAERIIIAMDGQIGDD